MSNLDDDYANLYDAHDKLRAGLRELADDQAGAPCSFWACPGADHPQEDMATCNVCYPVMRIRELLGDPPPVCTLLECISCGKESPWCEPCDEKLFYCKHCPKEE